MKFEYKIITKGKIINSLFNENELNELGKDGWEMFAVLERALMIQAFFKRQIK